MSEPTGATMRVAGYVSAATAAELPPAVMHEASRCLLNFVGCAIGGGDHAVVTMLERALLPYSGPATASLIGRRERADPLFAALRNGASATAHSFDDNHAEAVVHAGGPVGAAVLALAQARGASGSDALLAVALGVEVTCRLSKAVSVAPAVDNIAWYQTGITGGVGAAVAAGKLLGLDAARMAAAMGIAAAQASGSRILQGSMSMLMLSGHAAQAGLRAALLAEQGFESPRTSLEGPYGFLDVFSRAAHREWLDDGLGDRFEILATTYKAYPCGAVVQPVIDACLELRAATQGRVDDIAEIVVRASPAALVFSDRRHPASRTEGQVSLQHWAATALVLGRAGLREGREPALRDPAIAAVRERVRPEAQPAFARDEAQVVLRLNSGAMVTSSAHRGCLPMSDAALEAKLCRQAEDAFSAEHIERLLQALRDLPSAASVGLLAELL